MADNSPYYEGYYDSVEERLSLIGDASYREDTPLDIASISELTGLDIRPVIEERKISKLPSTSCFVVCPYKPYVMNRHITGSDAMVERHRNFYKTRMSLLTWSKEWHHIDIYPFGDSCPDKKINVKASICWEAGRSKDTTNQIINWKDGVPYITMPIHISSVYSSRAPLKLEITITF